MFACPGDFLELRHKILRLQRDSKRLRQLVQGIQSRSSALQGTGQTLADAPQAVGEWCTNNPRVKNNRVLGHGGQWAYGPRSLSIFCQPFPNLFGAVKDSLAVLTCVVKLGEYGPKLRGVLRVVAQHVSLAGVVADKSDRVFAGWRPYVNCSVGGRNQVADVLGVACADELGESFIQRRDPDVHLRLGCIGRQFSERGQQAAPHRLALDRVEICLRVILTAVSVWTPGYENWADALSTVAINADVRVVI